MNNNYKTIIGMKAGQQSGSLTRSLLDVEEVSSVLHCSTRHVYRLADSGKMPQPIKLGSLVRWSRDAIEVWINGGCEPVSTVRGGRRR